MDSVVLGGKKYISSKRASEITGYAKDYIGQLCRAGKLDARRVGRNWYVSEEEAREHQKASKREATEAHTVQVASLRPRSIGEVSKNKTQIYHDALPLRYSYEDDPGLLVPLARKNEKAIEQKVVMDKIIPKKDLGKSSSVNVHVINEKASQRGVAVGAMPITPASQTKVFISNTKEHTKDFSSNQDVFLNKGGIDSEDSSYTQTLFFVLGAVGLIGIVYYGSFFISSTQTYEQVDSSERNEIPQEDIFAI
jgi:hypothetical protein